MSSANQNLLMTELNTRSMKNRCSSVLESAANDEHVYDENTYSIFNSFNNSSPSFALMSSSSVSSSMSSFESTRPVSNRTHVNEMTPMSVTNETILSSMLASSFPSAEQRQLPFGVDHLQSMSSGGLRNGMGLQVVPTSASSSHVTPLTPRRRYNTYTSQNGATKTSSNLKVNRNVSNNSNRNDDESNRNVAHCLICCQRVINKNHGSTSIDDLSLLNLICTNCHIKELMHFKCYEQYLSETNIQQQADHRRRRNSTSLLQTFYNGHDREMSIMTCTKCHVGDLVDVNSSIASLSSSNFQVKGSYTKNSKNVDTYRLRKKSIHSGATSIMTNTPVSMLASQCKSNGKHSTPITMNKKSSSERFRAVSVGNSSLADGEDECLSPTQSKSALNGINLTLIGEEPNSNYFYGSIAERSKHAATGNMFMTRYDLMPILERIPYLKQNSVDIRLEDEGPYGNDETRCFVLSHLSSLRIKEIKCCLCECVMPVYERFPLVDGTLFVSPVRYETDEACNTVFVDDVNENINEHQRTRLDSSSVGNDKSIASVIPAYVANKNQFIYAICLDCMHPNNTTTSTSKPSHQIKCKHCHKVWSGGEHLQIGTMYKFEIFAAFPCCSKRFACSRCDKPVIDEPFEFFSQYSQPYQCPHCHLKDFHFIKNLKTFFSF